ncbi:MAG: MOP flippase family protein [Geobacteraceae bacterium]|nr:MOP flippase family protein [Geobacteraceae bacterium]
MSQKAIELKRVVLTGGVWSLVSTGVTALLSLCGSIFLARLLSPVDFGNFAIVTVVVSAFAAFSGLGIGMAMIQKKELTRNEISSAFWLFVFSNLTIFIIISAISPFIAHFFNEPIIGWLLPLTALSYVVGSVGDMYSFMLEKELSFVLMAKQEIFVELVAKAVTVCLAINGMGVWSLAWGELTLHTLLSILRVLAGWSKWQPEMHFHWGDIQKFLKFSFYMIGEEFLRNLSTKIDQILIGGILGVHMLGAYDFVVMRILTPLSTISMVILRNAFPLLAKIQYDKILLRQSFIILTKILNLIEAPLLLGTGVIAPILIPMLYGSEWSQAAQLAPALAATQIFRRINGQTDTLLWATGKPELSFRWNLLLTAICSGAIITGAFFSGISGIVMALLLTTAAGALVGYFILIKPILGECGKTLTTDTVVPIFLSGLIGVLVKTFSINYSLSTSWLAFTCIAGLALYLLLSWLFHRTFSVFNLSSTNA